MSDGEIVFAFSVGDVSSGGTARAPTRKVPFTRSIQPSLNLRSIKLSAKSASPANDAPNRDCEWDVTVHRLGTNARSPQDVVCSRYVLYRIRYHSNANHREAGNGDANNGSVYRSILSQAHRRRTASPSLERPTSPRQPFSCVRTLEPRDRKHKERSGGRSKLASVPRQHQKCISAQPYRLVRQIRITNASEASLPNRTSESVLSRYCISATRCRGNINHAIARRSHQGYSRAYG